MPTLAIIQCSKPAFPRAQSIGRRRTVMRRRLWIILLSLSLALTLAAPVFADTSYVVQPGDTLTKIAARFHVTVQALAAANQLSDPNAIRVGPTLTLPDGASQPAPAAGAPYPAH